MNSSVRQFIGLSIALAKAEIKQKNEGSYLGVLWYLLNPLFMFLLLLAVFSPRLGEDILNYPLYLLLGIILFNFFQIATTESTRIILQNRDIIRSIAFPQEVLILSIIIKTLFSHMIEMVLFIGIALFLQASITGIVFYPLILIFFSCFTFGISLILSALAVYVADLENIWIFFAKLIWFTTPIFYAIKGQNRLFFMNLFNPIYYFITISRDIIIYNQVPPVWLLLGGIFYSILFLVIGLKIYTHLKRKFAELI